MDDWRDQEALFRYGLIAAALDGRISNAERAPRRTSAQIARIIAKANGGVGPTQSTIERHLRRLGLARAALLGEREAFGRFEASSPNGSLTACMVR